jgi:CheY-like chemotaxis protein
MSPATPRILVVDDDEDVLDLAVLVLEEQGLDVVQARSGAEALAVLDRDPHIDLLFTDVMMPGMDGFTLALRARAAHPRLRILYTSGYLRNLPEGGEGRRLGKIVGKPWRPDQLRAEIREALQ